MKRFLRDAWQRILGPDPWCRIAEILVGGFLLGAALYKLRNYILIEDEHLRDHFQYWVNERWTVSWLPLLLNPLFDMPWGEQAMEIATILLQAIPGFLLIYGRGTRVAGALLTMIQSLVFLGTFHHRHFNEFVGISVWLGLFFALQPSRFTAHTLHAWWWRLMTWSLAGFVALYAYNRYFIGDAWTVNMAWMREHYIDYAVSSALWIKQLTIALTAPAWTMTVWASVWWITCAMIPLLLLPKTARFAGAMLLTLAVVRSMLWLNTYESQGVLWVIVLFLWTTYAVHEHQASMKAKRRKESWILRCMDAIAAFLSTPSVQ